MDLSAFSFLLSLLSSIAPQPTESNFFSFFLALGSGFQNLFYEAISASPTNKRMGVKDMGFWQEEGIGDQHT